MLAGILCTFVVILPTGFFFRQAMQERVANINGDNQCLLTQVSWVNNMSNNLRSMQLSNAQLG